MKYKYLILFIALCTGAPLAAQDDDPEARVLGGIIPENQITVLANGVREQIEESGESVSTFDQREIENLQGADLTRLLERAPGVVLSRNGGPGNFTGVRVRGAEGEQLLVLIDGVRVADVASPGGGFDFGNLLMGNLAKLELQRSSNSTIWGSQALGGVLAVTTGSRRGITASAEYGAHDTIYGTAGLVFDAGPAQLGLQASHFNSDGFSSSAAGIEADGFRQHGIAGQARAELVSGLNAFATARYADGRLDIDGFPAPNFTLADTAEFQDTRQLSGAAGLEYFANALELRAVLSLADTERANFDPAFGAAPGFTTDGESERAELRGRWRFANDLALDFGAEREWLRFSTLFDPLQRTAISGFYGQLDYDGGPLNLAVGARRDDHRDFGGEWSFGADVSYWIGEGWRLSASYGEGFKAPTLFQLHSDFGNGLLQPERSRSYDAGIGYGSGVVSARLTLFRRDTEDLIGFVSCFGIATGICTGRPFGTYDNIGRARAQGIEFEGELRLAEGLVAGAAYTLLDAEDRTAGSASEGNELSRRPEHALTVHADWQAIESLSFGADLRVVSDSFDDAGNMVPLDGHAVLTLRGEWDALDHVTLFGRVENLWDENYQTAAGYATPGRGAHVGARARF